MARFLADGSAWAEKLSQIGKNNGPEVDSEKILPYFKTISVDRAPVIHQMFTVSGIIRDAIWRVWRWDFLAEVRVQEGEPLENALRRFKRKVQQEDIIKEVKRHSYYLKPGEKKRVKAALARKRNRKKARKEQD
jgi:small subunit ribosomal protein S21